MSDFDPITRRDALEYALRFDNAVTVEELVDEARVIEAYLQGDDDFEEEDGPNVYRYSMEFDGDLDPSPFTDDRNPEPELPVDMAYVYLYGFR